MDADSLRTDLKDRNVAKSFLPRKDRLDGLSLPPALAKVSGLDL